VGISGLRYGKVNISEIYPGDWIKKIPPEGGIKGQKLKIIRINNNPQQLSKDIKLFI